MNEPTENPKSWEDYFKSIVRLHYSPANCRDVPDEHGGDFGIEIYAIEGHVFQCYLPEQHSDVKKLYEAQKKKINADIKKFSETNKDDLTRIFSGIRISRWILATPYSKSAQLVQFCAEKSLEVRALNLPYVSDDFQICVHTEDDYRLEVVALRREAYQIKLNFEKVSDSDADEWIREKYDFLVNLDRKVPKFAEKERLLSTKAFIVQKHLEYQNLLESLRVDWPDIYQIVVRLVGHRQRFLEGSFITASSALPKDLIFGELKRLEDDIKLEIKTISQGDIELMKWGVVSDWLIRCPLDF